MIRYFLLFCLLSLLPVFTFAQQNNSLSFIENNGQVKDDAGKTRNDILFTLGERNFKLFIANGKLYYKFSHCRTEAKEELLQFDRHDTVDRICSTEWFQMELVGANIDARVRKEEKRGYYENYILGSETSKTPEVITANSYGKIIFQEIYPGIDWILYTNEEGFKYDFLLKAGTNPDLIKFKYSGNANVQINESGALVVKTALGQIKELPPISFSGRERKNVASAFVMHGDGTIGFSLSSYNKKKELLIDPSVHWTTYFGGSLEDLGWSTAVDGNGNIYLTGETESNNNISVLGSLQSTIGGSYDAFVAKFNMQGNRLWSTYYGGSKDDRAFGVATDSSFNVYITGETFSDSLGYNGWQMSKGIYTDAFILKLNSGGQMIWSSYYGMAGDERAEWIICRGDKFFIGGRTNSPTGMAQNGYQMASAGNYDIFVAKFDTSCQRLWGTYYGGNLRDECYEGAIDSKGAIYLGGRSRSIGLQTTGAHQQYAGTAYCGLLIKFDSSGNLVWSTYLGGGFDNFRGLAIDMNDNVLFSGYSYAANLGFNGFQNNLAGNDDMVLAKFDSTGTAKWITYYGGAENDYSSDVITDEKNNIYLIGTTLNTTGLAFRGFQNLNANSAGGTDGLFVKFDSSGNRVWATFYGGVDFDYFSGVSLYGNKLILAGLTDSKNNLAGQNVYQSTYGGGYRDAALSVVNIYNIEAEIGNKKDYCLEDILFFNYSLHQTPASGNQVKLELSDSSGSFGNAQLLFSGYETTKGTKNKSIQLVNIQPFNGYRLRLLTTNPADTFYLDESINILPVADKSINSNMQGHECTGDTITLSAVSSADYRYLWYKDNVPTTNPDTLFQLKTGTTGSYKALLETKNGCKVFTAPISVVVNPRVDAALYTNDSVQCFAGHRFVLSDSSKISSGSYSRLWKFSDGLEDTAQTALRNFSTTGLYTNTIQFESDKGCRDSLSFSLEVLENPVSSFTVNDSDQCFKNNLLVLNDNSSGLPITNFHWNTGDTVYSGQNVNHSFGSAGTYTIIHTVVADNGCSDSSLQNISIYPQPQPAFGINDSAQCLKSNLFQFDNQSTITGGGSLNHSWYFDNGDSATANTVTKTFDTAGIYNIRLKVNSIHFCEESLTKSVVVLTDPEVTLILSSPAFCEGEGLMLEADCNEPYTFMWFQNGQELIGEDSCKYYISDSMMYSLAVTDPAGCKDTSNEVKALVHPLPAKPAISKNFDTLKAPAGFSNYTWYLNGQAINGVSQSTLVLTANGTYTVSVFNSFMCSSLSDPINVTNVSLPELSASLFSIYPNPASDIIHIEPTAFEKTYTLEVVDTYSRNVVEETSAEGRFNLNLFSCSAGTYYLLIKAEGRMSRYKLVLVK